MGETTSCPLTVADRDPPQWTTCWRWIRLVKGAARVQKCQSVCWQAHLETWRTRLGIKTPFLSLVVAPETRTASLRHDPHLQADEVMEHPCSHLSTVMIHGSIPEGIQTSLLSSVNFVCTANRSDVSANSSKNPLETVRTKPCSTSSIPDDGSLQSTRLGWKGQVAVQCGDVIPRRAMVKPSVNYIKARPTRRRSSHIVRPLQRHVLQYKPSPATHGFTTLPSIIAIHNLHPRAGPRQ